MISSCGTESLYDGDSDGAPQRNCLDLDDRVQDELAEQTHLLGERRCWMTMRHIRNIDRCRFIEARLYDGHTSQCVIVDHHSD